MPLPYFKFKPGEWRDGKIITCSMRAQGVFTNLCNLYWNKEGNICLSDVYLYFKEYTDEVDELLETEVLKIEWKGTNVEHKLGYIDRDKEEDKKEKRKRKEKVTISFLDKQLSEFGVIQKKRSAAGKESGMKRRRTREDVLAKKSKTFEKLVHPHSDKYEPAMIKDFIDYWTETKPTGLMMRWEMQAAFDIAKRLGTWNKNDKQYASRGAKNTVGSRSQGAAPKRTYRKSKEL